MVNINFVPDDYIQSNESRRTNLMYLVLLGMMMTAIGLSFITIKIQQRALSAKEQLVNAKMAQVRKKIKQSEKLRAKAKILKETALTVSELLEAVPRSVLLASLTNNLPRGVSLLRLNLIQKEPKKNPAHYRPPAANKYEAAKAQKNAPAQPETSKEKSLETHIDIEGIAPTDLQVAAYIKQLSNSSLLDKVSLVESKEHNPTYRGSNRPIPPNQGLRQFKLTAMLRKEVHLTNEDIKIIANSRGD